MSQAERRKWRWHPRRAEAGEPIRAIAAALHISPSCVSKWRKRLRETGALTPGQPGGHKPPTLVGENAEWLRARVGGGRFGELQGWLLAERGVAVSPVTVWRALAGLGLTRKIKSVRAVEQDRPDVAAARAAWRETQPHLDPARLVFVDETRASTNMARRMG